jgi:hypothetical protein
MILPLGHVARKANVVVDALLRIEFKRSAGITAGSAGTAAGSASQPVQLRGQAPKNFDEDTVQPLVCYAIKQGIDYEALAQTQKESPEVQLYLTA